MKVKPAATTPTPDNPAETTLSATAVASSTTDVKVTFTQAVDTDSITAANFKVSDEMVNVTNAVPSADGKSVDLTINGADYGKSYEMTVSGVKVAGAVKDNFKVSFQTPESTEAYPMTLTAADSVLQSTGATSTLVTFKVTDKAGNPLTNKVEVAFTASIGSFSEQRVTVKSDGTAENMFISESLSQTQTATLTATIVESDNKDLIGLYKTTTVKLSPNPDDLVDTSVGAILTFAEAETADRIIAYFDQEVHASDFRTSTGHVDENKYDVTVESGMNNNFDDNSGIRNKVVGIVDVPGEHALALLMEDPLVDNSNVKVTFEDKRNTSSKVSASNNARFKLTDARQPSVLDVKAVNEHELQVIFSEAVLSDDLANNQNAKKFVADEADNYLIDGHSVEVTYGVKDKDDKWGVDVAPSTDEDNARIFSSKDDTRDADGTKNGKISVGTFRDGTDNRHIVTIKVADDKPISAGRHSLQISNVGDWAANTDLERNTINTQTFDFDVVQVNEKPTFEVVEQSPEQYLLTFNTPVKVNGVADGKTLRTSNSANIASVLKLQVKNASGGWDTISDNWGTEGSGDNPIRVSQVFDENDAPTTQYIVEVMKDWTEVLNTRDKNKNFYNYDFRLHIDKDALYCSSNANLKNDAIDRALDGSIMKQPDNISPEIKTVIQATDNDNNLTEYYDVTMSEPVKLGNANGEGTTPAQGQTVPTPLAQFIKVDNSTTVNGIIRDNRFTDAYDTMFRVRPDGELSAGDWKLVVRSISDDIGNTASSTIGYITVNKESVTSSFKVVWAAVAGDKDYMAVGAGTNGVNSLTNGYGRYIFVKFNKPVSMVGGSKAANVTANYTLNGHKLPQGTSILANIAGYDDQDAVTDSITIVLPPESATQQEYTVSGKDSVLNIFRTITTSDGTETLSNSGELKLPYHIGEDGQYSNVDTKGDAVWGNDASEQFRGPNAATGYKTMKEYYKALVKALNDDQYRKIVLTTETGTLDLTQDYCSNVGTLKINRVVDIDLYGNDIKGNVNINTTDATASINIINTDTSRTANILGLTTNKKDDATLFVNAPNVREFILGGAVEVKCGNTDQTSSTNIAGISADTFINNGILNGVRITAVNPVGLENRSTINGTIEIDTTGQVNLAGSYPDTINVTKGATLNIVKGSTGVENATINVNAAATIKLPDNMTVAGDMPTIIVNVKKDEKVTVKAAPGTMDALADKLKINGDGKVDVVDSTNKDHVDTYDKIKAPSKAQEIVNGIADIITGSAVTVTGDKAVKDEVNILDGIGYENGEDVTVEEGKDPVKLKITVSGGAKYLEVKDNKVLVKAVNTTDETVSETITVKIQLGDATASVTRKVDIAPVQPAQ